jgi:transposase
MTNTQNTHSERSLYLALELGNQGWRLAFCDGTDHRQVNVPARDTHRFWREVEKAKAKFGLPPEAPVYSCYEAGRDGFWIHRMLEAGGVDNVVVDPASIEVNRRAKRVKTDRLDAAKLVGMLMRYRMNGETRLWSVIRVPTEVMEDQRRLHRNLSRLKKERGGHQARIRSLLCLQGITIGRIPNSWSLLRDWAGNALPPSLVQELTQESARIRLLNEQIAELLVQRRAQLRQAAAKAATPEEAPEGQAKAWARCLAQVKAVGEQTAWDLSHEFFGWRNFKNRREVGAAAGLVGSPYMSGQMRHEQGITKAGNPRVRHAMIELAWRWLRYQPQSALSRWYEERFGAGTGRMRRVGIVALARKLLIALWRYGSHGVVPAGALVKA